MSVRMLNTMPEILAQCLTRFRFLFILEAWICIRETTVRLSVRADVLTETKKPYRLAVRHRCRSALAEV